MISRTDWTVDKVRELLPDVPVKRLTGGEPKNWYCRGRQETFANLFNPTNHVESCQVSWRTLADCLNTGRPVTF